MKTYGILLFYAIAFQQLLSYDSPHQHAPVETNPITLTWQVDKLEESILNLEKNYPDRYTADRWLQQIKKIRRDVQAGRKQAKTSIDTIRKQALLAHPKLHNLSFVAIKMKASEASLQRGSIHNFMNSVALPYAHWSLSSVPQDAAGGAIVRLSNIQTEINENVIVPTRMAQPIAGLDLHWDADRLLFARRNNNSWKIYEVSIDGSNLRQVSKHEDDISSYEPCYLPNEKIIFASDACTAGVPCWNGIPQKVANLYLMDSDGGHVRQLTYDQVHNAQPTVIQDGRVVFNRWEYTGMNRVFNRLTMVMRPDGTGQETLFGTNTWYPNATYGHKEIPDTNKLVCIVAGYHRSNRSGYLGIMDPSLGDRGQSPLVKIITGTPQAPKNIIQDNLTADAYPKYTDPFPIDENYFLVSLLAEKDSFEIGIFLADTFGNLVKIKQEKGYAYLKPAIIKKRIQPRVIPEMVLPDNNEASVYIQDVYKGPGLKNVTRGTIEKVRVISYDYGYPTLAGVDKIGLSGPWDVMRIHGEATVHKDGSAFFNVPADTPIAFQLINQKGQAVQLMRSWTTAMPGEQMSCVGCHTTKNDAPTSYPTLALKSKPEKLKHWFGPPRGFDFDREIQPVLNKHCVSCHNGKNTPLDLRAKDKVPTYIGTVPGHHDKKRLNPKYKNLFAGKAIVPYTPAYEALIPYIRRVGVGDDVSLLEPGEYMANTSPLIQILEKKHHGLTLSSSDLKRFYTWIDLNGPCHGSWPEVFGIPPAEGMYKLRAKYRKKYRSKQKNLDIITTPIAYDESPATIRKTVKHMPISTKGWPLDTATIEIESKELSLKNDTTLKLIHIPAGTFVMGDSNHYSDEGPQTIVEIKKAFWMSETEISNKIFRQFRPEHNSRYYSKRHIDRTDNQGIDLDEDEQPVLRVSWHEAMAFCQWLSEITGYNVTLPTEAQWEYACRAGSDNAFSFGDSNTNFSKYANLADLTFASKGITGPSNRGLFVVAQDVECLVSEGVIHADKRFDDSAIVPTAVNRYAPNPFGLKNMHGNVAEWTRSLYWPYPYKDDDGRNHSSTNGERVARGGSYFDPPKNARSASRQPYHPWQPVHNVGFRIIIENDLSSNKGS